MADSGLARIIIAILVIDIVSGFVAVGMAAVGIASVVGIPPVPYLSLFIFEFIFVAILEIAAAIVIWAMTN